MINNRYKHTYIETLDKERNQALAALKEMLG
jgi:hypothetical protein